MDINIYVQAKEVYDELLLVGLAVICLVLVVGENQINISQIFFAGNLIINELTYFRNVGLSAVMRAASTIDTPRQGASFFLNLKRRCFKCMEIQAA